MNLYDLACRRSLLNTKITITRPEGYLIIEKVTKVDLKLGEYVFILGDESPDEDGTKKCKKIIIDEGGKIELECDYSNVMYAGYDYTANVEESSKGKFSRY